MLTLCVVTFNLGNKPLRADATLNTAIPANQYDIYAIGAQVISLHITLHFNCNEGM